jgi:hypothetical protein
VKRNGSDEERTGQWSLSTNELDLLPNRVEHKGFGFAVQRKFFQIKGQFPRSQREIPARALQYLAVQLGFSGNGFQKYDWRASNRGKPNAWVREASGAMAEPG